MLLNGEILAFIEETIREFNKDIPAVYTITFTHNGTISNGNYFGVTENISGDDTPVVIPLKSELISFAFSNNKTNADFTLLFKKNSIAATPFLSVSRTNTQLFAQSLVTPEQFVAGDRIFIQYQDDGTNASDVSLNLFFRAQF